SQIDPIIPEGDGFDFAGTVGAVVVKIVTVKTQFLIKGNTLPRIFFHTDPIAVVPDSGLSVPDQQTQWRSLIGGRFVFRTFEALSHREVRRGSGQKIGFAF